MARHGLKKKFWSLSGHRYQTQSLLMTICAAIDQGKTMSSIKTLWMKKTKISKIWPKYMLYTSKES